MQTPDCLGTIVFRVGKQWDYYCHMLDYLHGENNSPQSAFYTDRNKKEKERHVLIRFNCPVFLSGRDRL